MIVARQLDEVRAGDEAGDVAAFLDAQAPIAGAMHDQRRHLDRRQDVADVDLGVHSRERDRSGRTRAHPQVRRPPVAKRPIAGDARRPGLDADRTAPALENLAAERFALLLRRRPRVVGRSQTPRVGADHDERFGLVRVRGGEKAAHRPAFGHAKQHGAPRADGVQHRPHVVHALFERRQIRHAIGQAGAALVEEDQPRETRQPPQESRERRLVPEVLEVRHPAHHEDEVDRAAPKHLIRDVDVAASRVVHGKRRCRGGYDGADR